MQDSELQYKSLPVPHEIATNVLNIFTLLSVSLFMFCLYERLGIF